MLHLTCAYTVCCVSNGDIPQQKDRTSPRKETLDSLRTLSWFVSYRRLSSQFQFSLSAVTLEYLSQWCCPTNILTAHRGTLTPCITFKREGRGESVLLYSVVFQLWRPASTPRVRKVTKFPKVGPLLIFSISLVLTFKHPCHSSFRHSTLSKKISSLVSFGLECLLNNQAQS
jgi:hypothetical protein